MARIVFSTGIVAKLIQLIASAPYSMEMRGGLVCFAGTNTDPLGSRTREFSCASNINGDRLPCYSRHLGEARNKVAGRITRDDSCYSKLWPREFVHTVHAWRVMLGIELWRMRLAACQL